MIQIWHFMDNFITFFEQIYLNFYIKLFMNDGSQMTTKLNPTSSWTKALFMYSD